MLTIISASVNIYLNKKDREDKSVSKKYEELGITDAFMFAKVMSNKEICTPVLEHILNIKIINIFNVPYLNV